MLKGEFVSAGSDSFAMLVKHSNKHARALRGKQVTLKVDGKTKFRRSGPAKLSDLAAGDRLHVLVRAKKGEDALELLARLVHARKGADRRPSPCRRACAILPVGQRRSPQGEPCAADRFFATLRGCADVRPFRLSVSQIASSKGGCIS